MNKIKTAVFSLTLLPLVSGLAAASDDSRYDLQDKHKCHYDDRRHCWRAPEIDAGQALGALAMLGGTVAIVRGYRRKKK